MSLARLPTSSTLLARLLAKLRNQIHGTSDTRISEITWGAIPSDTQRVLWDRKLPCVSATLVSLSILYQLSETRFLAAPDNRAIFLSFCSYSYSVKVIHTDRFRTPSLLQICRELSFTSYLKIPRLNSLSFSNYSKFTLRCPSLHTNSVTVAFT